MLKRSIDVIGSLLALVLSLPVFLVIAIAIKLDTPGPIFYSQTRVGLRGRRFRAHKFRSMVVDAERLGPPVTANADPRITRVGRILRLLRLDELPQLVNVLKGEMSLVGPRPEVPSVVEQYTQAQLEILEVKPGITGPTQLSWLDESERYPPGVGPYEHYTKNFLHQKLQSDLVYVRTRSLRSDVWYLMQTPAAIGRAVLSRFDPSSRAQKWIKLVADCVAVAVANLGAFLVRFDWTIPAPEMPYLLYGLPVTCAAYLFSFLTMRTYRSIWRYSSVEDLWQVIKSSVFGGTLHALAVVLLGWRPYSRAVFVSTALLTILLMGGMRLVARLSARGEKARPSARSRRRVVIVGAGKTGESLAREIHGNPALGYDLIGFVDDDPKKVGQTLHNVRVLGTIERLADLARVHHVQEAIIAVSSLAASDMRRISQACVRAGLKFRTLPSLSQLMRGEGKLRYLREVSIGDLLRREPVSIDELGIAEFLRGKRVMVTGAGGSIGSELCRQILRLGVESLIMVERAENALHDISLEMREYYPKVALTAALADVKHVPRMSEIFQRFKPNVVFHAAAYKHVPILEDHPGEAVLNNVVGTKRLAEVALRFGAETFVLISTDKAAKPSNLMGATKRICEEYITALNGAMGQSNELKAGTRFVVVRFGNVLGSSGSVVPLFQRQIENGGPITITDPEVSRFFMTASEAVGLVLQSVTLATGGDVFILDMGEPVRIAELADDLVSSLGLSPSEVARKYVGLRPGDKMHEVLWDDEEEMLPSVHGKIFAIRRRHKPLAEVEALVGQLETLAIQGNVVGLLQKIHDVVPTYCPSFKTPPFTIPEAGEKYRVLVVDDDDRICDVLQATMAGAYEVATVHSAREAFDRLQAETPHLILLDVKLPDQSGLEMCRTLRAHPEYHPIPIILMTGYGDKDTVVTGLRAGADDHLSKPFRVEELLARIEAVLRRRA